MPDPLPASSLPANASQSIESVAVAGARQARATDVPGAGFERLLAGLTAPEKPVAGTALIPDAGTAPTKPAGTAPAKPAGPAPMTSAGRTAAITPGPQVGKQIDGSFTLADALEPVAHPAMPDQNHPAAGTIATGGVALSPGPATPTGAPVKAVRSKPLVDKTEKSSPALPSTPAEPAIPQPPSAAAPPVSATPPQHVTGVLAQPTDQVSTATPAFATRLDPSILAVLTATIAEPVWAGLAALATPKTLEVPAPEASGAGPSASGPITSAVPVPDAPSLAGAAAPTSTAAPQPLQITATQIAPALVHVGRTDAVQHLTIRLDPAELGRIEIRIERGDNGPARIELSAGRQETLDLMRHDQPALHRALDQAGVPVEGRQLTFSLSPDLAGQDGGSGGAFSGSGLSNNSGSPQPGGGRSSRRSVILAGAWRRAGLDVLA